MFLCARCHGPAVCWGNVVRSKGLCESCGEPAACLDCHNSSHREGAKKKEEQQ